MYHGAVRRALEQDGWTITDDPLILPFGQHNLFVDLGAEAPIAAEKEGRKIAVEVKGFAGASDVVELERAVGQYALYGGVLAETHPERTLYLAVTLEAYAGVFRDPLGQLMIERQQLRLVVFDRGREVITRWIE